MLMTEPIEAARRAERSSRLAVFGKRLRIQPERSEAPAQLGQLMPRMRSLTLLACGPRSADILSRYGSATFWKPDLSTSLTILTPMDLSLVADSCSSAIAFTG